MLHEHGLYHHSLKQLTIPNKFEITDSGFNALLCFDYKSFSPFLTLSPTLRWQTWSESQLQLYQCYPCSFTRICMASGSWSQLHFLLLFFCVPSFISGVYSSPDSIPPKTQSVVCWARCPVYSIVGSNLLWASGREDFSLGLNMGSDSIPPKLGWEYKPRSGLCTHAFHGMDSKDPDIYVLDRWMPATKTQHAQSTKTEYDYLNDWIKKRSHTQKSHPKSWTSEIKLGNAEEEHQWPQNWYSSGCPDVVEYLC